MSCVRYRAAYVSRAGGFKGIQGFMQDLLVKGPAGHSEAPTLSLAGAVAQSVIF